MDLAAAREVLLQGDGCSNDSHPSDSFPDCQLAHVHTHSTRFKALPVQHQIASFNIHSQNFLFPDADD